MAFGVDGTPEADEIIRTRLEKCLTQPDPKTGRGHTVYFDPADTRTCPRCGINRPFAVDREEEEENYRLPGHVSMSVRRIVYTNVRLI